jgi:hypothetical protein
MRIEEQKAEKESKQQEKQAPKKNFLQSVYSYFSEDLEDKDETNIPEMTWLSLFARFLWFGLRAFGGKCNFFSNHALSMAYLYSSGPVAQIALMKQELITQEKWISTERFTRVYSVYQVLPGPEAMELACYFGYLAKGRLGSIIGGLGFLLPGFLMMLLASYLYKVYGIESRQVQVGILTKHFHRSPHVVPNRGHSSACSV